MIQMHSQITHLAAATRAIADLDLPWPFRSWDRKSFGDKTFVLAETDGEHVENLSVAKTPPQAVKSGPHSSSSIGFREECWEMFTG